MTSMTRARIINQQYVSAPAAEIWDVLTDWANTERLRRPDVDPGALAVESVDLIGDPGSTPRTRVFNFKSDHMPVVKETLLHQDDELRHFYYNMEGVGPLGIRNYLATTDVDEISETVSLVTITARFDIPEGVDVIMAKGMINAAHTGVILGLKHNLER